MQILICMYHVIIFYGAPCLGYIDQYKESTEAVFTTYAVVLTYVVHVLTSALFRQISNYIPK